jgi:flagellar motor switch protein FliM
VLELSTNIGYAIIDRILGGPGFGISKIRDFTEIEKILLTRVLTQLLSFLPEPWDNVAPVRPRLDKIETNSQFAQIIAPTEMAALVTLSIKVGSIEGMLNFVIPHMSIEKFMDRLNTRFWFATVGEEEDAERHRAEVEERLKATSVPIKAIIGKTRIAVSDFVDIQIGDIIPLDSYVSSDMQIYVGNLLKFTAKPGVARGRNAVQITSVIEREE